MIDSSIIRQIPKLNSPLFKQIIKYIHIGRFCLYISEIIEQEYLTWIQKEAQEAYNTVVKASESLNKFYDEPEIFGIKMHLNITADVAGNHINEILKKISSNWKNFKEQTDAIILPIGNDHGKLVMNAYFDGSAPFKTKKNRSDIPDAFIYCSLLDLLHEHEKVIFISQDKEFCNRIKNDNIIVFNNLTELFNCDEYKLTDAYFNELPDERKREYLFKYYKDEIIKKTKRQIELSDLISDIEYEYRANTIGNYRNEYSSAEFIEFNYNKVNNLSPNIYLIPFSAKVKYTISSEATNNDLENYSKERLKNLTEKSINDNGLYDVSEEIEYSVFGNVSVKFAETNPLLWEEQEVKDSLFKELEITEITVTIENIEKNA